MDVEIAAGALEAEEGGEDGGDCGGGDGGFLGGGGGGVLGVVEGDAGTVLVEGGHYAGGWGAEVGYGEADSVAICVLEVSGTRGVANVRRGIWVTDLPMSTMPRRYCDRSGEDVIVGSMWWYFLCSTWFIMFANCDWVSFM